LNKVSSFKLFSKVTKHPKIPNSQKWHSLHSHTNFSHNGNVFRCFSFLSCLPTCFPFLFVWTLVASLKIGLWHYAWLLNWVSPKESWKFLPCIFIHCHIHFENVLKPCHAWVSFLTCLFCFALTIFMNLWPKVRVMTQWGKHWSSKKKKLCSFRLVVIVSQA
jgi:hypothetical protein